MAQASPRIPVVLVVDVEPDGHFIDRTKPVPWTGYEKGAQFLNALRPRVAAATGAPARYAWAFRMDPQITDTYGRIDWALHHYIVQFKSFVHFDDALGLHVHAYRWDEAARDWRTDHGDAAYMASITSEAVHAFREAAGRGADFFRYGERWMSDAAMAQLEALGVPGDMTLEPGHGPVASYHPQRPHTGSIPDQRGVPRGLYRPAPGNFRKASARREGFWELPLTTAVLKPRFRLWLPSLPHTANLYLPPKVFRRIVDEALGRPRPYLAIVVRTNVFSGKEKFENLKASLEALLARREARHFIFTTPAEAAAMLSGGDAISLGGGARGGHNGPT